MYLFLKAVLLAIGLISLVSAAVRAETDLSIMTEDFPPFNYVEHGELIGVGPDVVRTLMKRLEMPGKIRVLGWKHAYDLTLQQPNMVLFSMARIPEREDKFKWVGPLMSVTDYFFANRDFPADHLTREESRKVKGILVQEGGAHHQLLKAEGFTNLLPYTNVAEQVKLLTIGRGSLLQINDLTIVYQLQKQELPLDLVKPVLALQKTDLYIAFSKGTDDDIVSRWQAALDRLRESGEFDLIEARYKPRFTGLPPQ